MDFVSGRSSKGNLFALTVAFAARLLPLLVGFEHYGDAPVRIEAAERWALSPHLWHGFAESFQYGPLQLTLIGTLVHFGVPRIAAARALSLVCGLVSVWLLGQLTLRFRDERSAFWAMIALALSPLHIQASTTGASEAVFLALILGCLVLLDEHWFIAALLLGAAGLVRYDGWLYAPLIVLLRIWRRRPFLLFAAVAAAPAIGWMLVNLYYVHDALAPIHWIDRDHRALAAMVLQWFGPLRWRAYGLVYWPISVCGVLSPVVGALAILGALRALRKRSPGFEYAVLAWLPALYFTFRTVVLLDFRPMARFTMMAAALSLPFLLDVFYSRLVRVLAVLSLVAWPLTLAGLSWNRNGSAAEWARPLSPISSVPPGIASAASWIRANASPFDVVLVDTVWDYLDVPLIFAAGLPDHRWIRASWTDDFEQRLARMHPTMAVLLYEGKLGDWTRDTFDFRGQHFCLQHRWVYASIYRECSARKVQ